MDTIGVLIFDNSYQWAVPIRRAEDKSLIKRLISGITPDGGTQIAPALNEAYRRVINAHSTYKHIVLLTDGISEEGDSLELSKEASAIKSRSRPWVLGKTSTGAISKRLRRFQEDKAIFLTSRKDSSRSFSKTSCNIPGPPPWNGR